MDPRPIAPTREPRPLTLQMLAWLATAPRSYRETMDAWRSSCPRLTIWEDALADRLVRVASREVEVTAEGRAVLERFS